MKTEVIDFSATKSILDKKYLQNCLEHHIFPEFLNIKIGPDNRRQISLATKFKIETIKNEIQRKKIQRDTLIDSLRKLTGRTNFEFLFERLSALNSCKLTKVENTHHQKFCKHLIKSGYLKKCSTDINKTIFTESDHPLSPQESSKEWPNICNPSEEN